MVLEKTGPLANSLTGEFMLHYNQNTNGKTVATPNPNPRLLFFHYVYTFVDTRARWRIK